MRPQPHAEDDFERARQTHRIDNQSLGDRVLILEQYRLHHDKEHAENTATHAWVYRRGFALIGGVAVICATLLATIARLWLP